VEEGGGGRTMLGSFGTPGVIWWGDVSSRAIIEVAERDSDGR